MVVVVVGVVSVVVVGDDSVVVVGVALLDVLGAGAVPWSPPSNSVMPKAISPIKMTTSNPQPISTTGLRYHGLDSGSSSSGS